MVHAENRRSLEGLRNDPPMLHFAACHKFWDLPAGPTQWCQSNLRQGTRLPTCVQHRCCSSDISRRNGFQYVYSRTTSQRNRGERWHPTKEPGRWHATLATKMDHIGLHTLMVINASTTGVFYCFSIIMSPNDEHKHTETQRHRDTHTHLEGHLFRAFLFEFSFFEFPSPFYCAAFLLFCFTVFFLFCFFVSLLFCFF